MSAIFYIISLLIILYLLYLLYVYKGRVKDLEKENKWLRTENDAMRDKFLKNRSSDQ
jgi:hypothetical protein